MAKAAGRKKKAKPVSLAPGYEGKRQLVEDQVQQPFGRLGATEPVMRNARHDPIEQLFHQTGRNGKKLIDQAQYHAAVRIRMLVETIGLGKLRSMALDMERVDGGAVARDIGIQEIEAASLLKKLRLVVGWRPYMVLIRVAGYGESISDVAVDFEREPVTKAGKAANKPTRDGVGSLLRDALTDAAIFLGFQSDTSNDRGWRKLAQWRAEDVLVREDLWEGN